MVNLMCVKMGFLTVFNKMGESSGVSLRCVTGFISYHIDLFEADISGGLHGVTDIDNAKPRLNYKNKCCNMVMVGPGVVPHQS